MGRRGSSVVVQQKCGHMRTRRYGRFDSAAHYPPPRRQSPWITSAMFVFLLRPAIVSSILPQVFRPPSLSSDTAFPDNCPCSFACYASRSCSLAFIIGLSLTSRSRLMWHGRWALAFNGHQRLNQLFKKTSCYIPLDYWFRYYKHVPGCYSVIQFSILLFSLVFVNVKLNFLIYFFLFQFRWKKYLTHFLPMHRIQKSFFKYFLNLVAMKN